MSRTLIIAGGGIAGLAAAIALRARGIDVVVIERRSEASGEGAGIQIGPNGVAVLRRLGLDEAVAAHASVPSTIRVHDGMTGRRLTDLPLGGWIERRHGAPYWVVHRADLMRVLVDVAQRAGVDIRMGTTCLRANETPGAVEIVCADGARLSGTALIGADGLWSTVRHKHFDATAPVASGRAAARALIAADAATGIASDLVSVWMAPGAHVVAYPVRSGRMLNLVVIARADAAADRWSEPVAAADIARRVDGFTPALSRLIASADGWRQWPLMTRAPLTSFARGRAALIGDAAHPMLPFLAQGAVMALEDAVQLAQCVAATRDDFVAGLQAFSQARVARTQRVVETAEQQGRIYHLAGAARLGRDAALKFTPPTMLMARYDWLYGWGKSDGKPCTAH